MKATLEFIFPADREDYEITMKANALYSAANEFENHLRNLVKYDGWKEQKMHLKTIEKLREEFNNMFRDLL